MDAYELMRQSAEFASFLTTGKHNYTDEDVDDEEEDLEEEEKEVKKEKVGGSLPNKSKMEVGKAAVLIRSGLEKGNSKGSGKGSFANAPNATPTIAKQNAKKVSRINSSKCKLLDDIVEKRWQVEELDPFAMNNEQLLEELNKLSQEDKKSKGVANSQQQKKVPEKAFKPAASTNSKHLIFGPPAPPTSKSVPISATPTAAITTNTYHRRSSNPSVTNEEKARRLMLQLDAIEYAYTTNSITITTPSFSPIKPPPPPASTKKPSSLLPAIPSRIIPERRSATRAIASIKQEAMGEKAIERLMGNGSSSANQQQPVLATKSSPGKHLTSSTTTFALKSSAPPSKSAKINGTSCNSSNSAAHAKASSSSKHLPPSLPISPTHPSTHQPRQKPSTKKRRTRRSKYATEEERLAASKANARQFRQRYKESETEEQRLERLKKGKLHRLLSKGLYEEAVEFAAEENVRLTPGQELTIYQKLDDSAILRLVSEREKKLTAASASATSAPKVIQITSTKNRKTTAMAEKGKAPSNGKKRGSTSEAATEEKPKPKKAKVTHAYFGVDKAWDQLVIAQEVAKTTVTRAGRQCKAKNWVD